MRPTVHGMTAVFMKPNLLTEIEERLPTFSKGQKLISNYIMENYDKAAYMTAAKLGRIVNVSESTVVRNFSTPSRRSCAPA